MSDEPRDDPSVVSPLAKRDERDPWNADHPSRVMSVSLFLFFTSMNIYQFEITKGCDTHGVIEIARRSVHTDS